MDLKKIQYHTFSPYFAARTRRLAAVAVLLIFGLLLNAMVFFRVDYGRNGCSIFNLASGYQGVVASENKICSDIGVDILKVGGNAIDAIIATGLCIGTTNMYSSGIGGGGFLLYHQPMESIAFDFREAAPAGTYPDMYVKDPNKAREGGLAVGVPGEIMGYYEAWRSYGKLSWKELLEPSIKLAERGWLVNKFLANRIKKSEGWILKNPLFARTFAPDGRILSEGDIIARPIYAKTLSTIANEGPDVFYKGWIARELVKTIQNSGGIMTMEDFSRYSVRREAPISSTYRGCNIIAAPPPASGAVLLSALNILEKFDNFSSATPLNMHRIVESFKFGYAKRGMMGDPVDPVFRNISQIVKKFVSKEMAEFDFTKLDDEQTFDPIYYQPNFTSVENHGTMHVSVLTSDGHAASLTSTVNLLFGAKLIDNATDIILNDEMVYNFNEDDFSIPGIPNSFGLEPSPYNYARPGKRPLSSSAPTIVEKDGSILAVVGASGGSHITTATLEVLVRMIDFDYNPVEAVEAPRFHHQLMPNSAWVEYEMPDDFVNGLKARGHKVCFNNEVEKAEKGVTVTGVSAIKRLSNGILLGSGDFRKGGAASSY